jgi:antitoxin (DNA-binding transcriptional repressor) of toxin-antitoxin stability system
MNTVSLQEAQAHLAQWIAKLAPGEELLIVEASRPIARLVAEPLPERKRRQPGGAKGQLTIVVEDETHLDDFKEYMP